MADIYISDKASFDIPDGLFGMNMEITRTTFWRGLSAEMLNNRKFFTGENMPYAWTLEEGSYIKDPSESCCESSFVRLSCGGKLAYTDGTVILEEGHKYTCRITYGRAAAGSQILVEIGGFSAKIPIAETYKNFASFEFVSDVSCKADYSITLSEGEGVSIYAVSLMDSDNYYGMRPDVIEMLKELRPSYFRFPGGCCADHFEWKEGLKPKDERKPMDGSAKRSFLFRNSYAQDANDFGINEFIMLTRAVSCDKEYTMRLVLNDSEEARSLVEYCNGDESTYWGGKRVEQGFKEPFDIKLWYIGNEIYYFGYGLEFDPVGAGKKTDEYIRAMRLADPTIKTIIGVCTGTDGNVEWSRKYIENIHEKIDYISYHRYNGTEIDSVESDLLHADAVRKMVSDKTDRGLEIIKNDCCKGIFEEVLVDIDEWNYSWGLKGSNLMTLSNALMMNFMISQSNNYHISDARFFHPINEGMIDVDLGKKPELDSSGVLFNLFNKHRGGAVLESVSDDNEIDVLASKNAKGMCITLINRSEQCRTVHFTNPVGRLHITLMHLMSISGLNNTYTLSEFVLEDGESLSIPDGGIVFAESGEEE